MNKQKFIYLILTISVLISFTACNEAEDSIPTDGSADTPSTEQITPSEPTNNDLVLPSTEDTPHTLDYTLPDDDVIIEDTLIQEDTSIITYTSSDENVTVLDNNVTVPDNNITVPDDNVTVSDNNITAPENNVTIQEEIIVVIEYTTGFVGKLVDSYVSGVEYTCDGVTKTTDNLGRFNCQTTPIEFSLGNISLGSIQKMTTDYLIFPQDLLGLQRGAALHPEVTKMILLFQSLDNDANPDNGIVISQETINLLSQELIQKINIQDITLVQLSAGIEKVIENALLNDSASQLQLVAIKQAQDHLLKSLSTILISPIQP